MTGAAERAIAVAAVVALCCAALAGCSEGGGADAPEAPAGEIQVEPYEPADVSDKPADPPAPAEGDDDSADGADDIGGADGDTDSAGAEAGPAPSAPTAEELRAALPISEDYRPSFVHGDKGPEFQKYIVLHDTEGDSDAESVIDWWDSNGNLVAAHFVINRDGSIVQCAPLDAIVHHAGYGDAGHNELYGVEDESRDDMAGTTPIGSWAPDYGMNSHSVGIELVHVGGSGDYPEAQLESLDALIAYIDAYYGFESEIIDHKAWRSGNSDTSPEFAGYLANYRDHRTHE